MVVITRNASKKFREDIQKAIEGIYGIDKVGLKKLNEVIKALNLNGWSINDVKNYVAEGLNINTVKPLATKKHHIYSGSGYCEVIETPDLAIYDLHFLRVVANVYKIKYDIAIGRGTQARIIREAIDKAVEKID